MKRIALLILFYFSMTSIATAAARHIEIAPRDVPVVIELPGRVSALVISEVRPQADGIVTERLFNEGDDVKKGQVLYKIDPDIYIAKRDRAKAVLDEAMARANETRRVEARRKNLSRSKAVSQQDLDNAISERVQAEARVSIAKAELKSAEIDLAHTDIKAHSDGRIGISQVHPGSLVTANQAAPLNIVQRIDKVYVDIQRPSEDNRPVRSISLKGHENKLENMFTDISVGKDTGDVTLRAVFDNADSSLLPGAYVTAMLDLGILKNAILVPQKAVMSGPGGTHYLFILKPEKGKFKVERKKVSLGTAIDNYWLINDGANAGDIVLTEGLQRAADGDIIESQKE